MTTQVKAWCYTLNNYTEEEVELMKGLKCKYHIIGFEKGENNTPHLQGYIEFEKKRRLGGLKGINERIHWEVRRGLDFEARDYCAKEGDLWESGEFVRAKPGKRNDIIRAVALLREDGMSAVKAVYPDTYVKYYKGLQKININEVDMTDQEREVIVYLGEPGIGKTRKAYKENPEAFRYPPIERGGTPWADGYNGEDCIIFDDYAGEIPFRMFLRIIDRYSMTMPIKGGFVDWNPKKIIITSNFHPTDWYKFNQNDDVINKRALMRRFTEVVEMINDQ